MVRRRQRRGFTLIELLLVLVILAVLAGVVLTNFAGKSEQARITAAKTDITNVDSALSAFEQDTGAYPTTDQGLAALMDPPAGVTNWHGPYLKKAMKNDPWGMPYIYISPGTHSKAGYDLYSTGPNKVEGGNDDITSWDTQ